MRAPDEDPWFRIYPFPVMFGPANWKGWLLLVGIMLASAILGIVTNSMGLPQNHPHF